MKACPMKAIRVRDGKARIEGVCIDCGECYRVCPRGAVSVFTAGRDVSRLGYGITVIASPVMYAQFGEATTPNEILAAVERIFGCVYDQAYACEMFNLATEFYLRENRVKKDALRPLISPFCPVVNRIIAYRFPSLLKHLLPINTPREIAAKDIRERALREGFPPGEPLRVYQITSCSANMKCIREPLFLKKSNLDGALGISEIYEMVKGQLHNSDEEPLLFRSGGVGIGWGICGGEIAGLGEGNYIAVSGVQETIRYLEKIEMGLVRNIEYCEFRSCLEGCVAGPLTITDRYEAKRILQRQVSLFGQGKRLNARRVKKAYDEGWFFTEKRGEQPSGAARPMSISGAIERQEGIERIFRALPEKECGACGSPDCRTFAEDVADGRSDLERCVFLKKRKEGQGE